MLSASMRIALSFKTWTWACLAFAKSLWSTPAHLWGGTRWVETKLDPLVLRSCTANPQCSLIWSIDRPFTLSNLDRKSTLALLWKLSSMMDDSPWAHPLSVADSANPWATSLGVLGGSGVYKMPEPQAIQEHEIETPFGKPSDNIIETEIQNRSIFFLPRHGRGHRLLPSEIPAKANIYALKKLGVTHVLAISACGIMRENINPGDMIVPDQIFDRTKGTRSSTFFGDGIVGHVAFADPFCNKLRSHILEATKVQNMNSFDGGTYICMEGPQFSTRSESNFYRKTVNASVIGMTALPEAKLAREAELCYAMLALGTDYDCWHEEADDVNIEIVINTMNKNTNNDKIHIHVFKDIRFSGGGENENNSKTLHNIVKGFQSSRNHPIMARYMFIIAYHKQLGIFDLLILLTANH